MFSPISASNCHSFNSICVSVSLFHLSVSVCHSVPLFLPHTLLCCLYECVCLRLYIYVEKLPAPPSLSVCVCVYSLPPPSPRACPPGEPLPLEARQKRAGAHKALPRGPAGLYTATPPPGPARDPDKRAPRLRKKNSKNRARKINDVLVSKDGIMPALRG